MVFLGTLNRQLMTDQEHWALQSTTDARWKRLRVESHATIDLKFRHPLLGHSMFSDVTRKIFHQISHSILGKTAIGKNGSFSHSGLMSTLAKNIVAFGDNELIQVLTGQSDVNSQRLSRCALVSSFYAILTTNFNSKGIVFSSLWHQSYIIWQGMRIASSPSLRVMTLSIPLRWKSTNHPFDIFRAAKNWLEKWWLYFLRTQNDWGCLDHKD